jgi:hypothetical protein
MRHPLPHQSPQPLFDHPQIGGLADERRAVDAGQGGKEGGMLAAKIVIDGRVLIQSQELPHHFHRQHLGVIQGRGWSAAAHPLPVRMSAHLAQQLIDQAVDGYHECFQVHGAPP